MSREAVIERVKKILAKADPSRNDCEAEAVNAMRIAKRLMAEYDLEMSDVEIPEGEEQAASFDFCNVENETEVDARTVQGVFWGVVRAVRNVTNTDAFRSADWGKSSMYGSYRSRPKYKVTFCGTKTDAAVASAMFTILWNMMKERARNVAREHGCSSDRMFVRSYEAGFASGLVRNSNAIAEEKDVFEDAKKNECYALMVVNKEQALATWMKQEHSRLKTVSSGSGVQNLNGGAYSRGVRDGKAVNLRSKGCIA